MSFHSWKFSRVLKCRNCIFQFQWSHSSIYFWPTGPLSHMRILQPLPGLNYLCKSHLCAQPHHERACKLGHNSTSILPLQITLCTSLSTQEYHFFPASHWQFLFQSQIWWNSCVWLCHQHLEWEGDHLALLIVQQDYLEGWFHYKSFWVFHQKNGPGFGWLTGTGWLIWSDNWVCLTMILTLPPSARFCWSNNSWPFGQDHVT